MQGRWHSGVLGWGRYYPRLATTRCRRCKTLVAVDGYRAVTTPNHKRQSLRMGQVKGRAAHVHEGPPNGETTAAFYPRFPLYPDRTVFGRYARPPPCVSARG